MDLILWCAGRGLCRLFSTISFKEAQICGLVLRSTLGFLKKNRVYYNRPNDVTSKSWNAVG